MRLADGEPLVYNRTYLPEKIFSNLILEDLNQGTLYSHKLLV
ncbi:MAG: UTRA domain-containing protein [Lactococcus raffinolactis]|nr:UTRA domain-containing protein [Lactococcus raffinolactis]